MSGSHSNNRHRHTKSAVALALSFAAGAVDIVGALTVYDMFTAHVTGTTVRLGEKLAERDWKAATAAIIVVGSFFAASLAGRVLIESAQRARFKRIASISLFVEMALLLFVVAAGRASVPVYQGIKSFGLVCILLGMLAGAMGLQTATLTKIGPLTVHTTFVTGMINKLSQVVARWLFSAYDLQFKTNRLSATDLRRDLHDNARQARFFFSIWILYLAGAGCGTLLDKSQQLKALYLPCAILLGAIAVDQARPLSIEEEQEQTE